MSENPGRSDAAVVYHLRPHDTGARLFEVFCRVREPDPDGQVFSLPAWIPGSYLIRDFARHVVAIEASGDGGAVALRKLDKHTWRAAPVAGELVVRAEIYAADGSVRGAHLDRDGAFFNGSSVFLRVHGCERQGCLVHLTPAVQPGTGHWRVATTLRRLTGAEWDFGAFEAGNYEELIDHPVLMGALHVAGFTAADTPHAVVLAGRHEADSGRLCEDLSRLCTWQVDFFGRPAPMSRYLFLVRLTGQGMGGLEHRASSTLVCHRNDLPRQGTGAPTKDYRRFLGLASHEYFHAWHVKRVRPAELAGADLGRESYTRQLWIFEGITAYYDDLALLRSGVIGQGAYLELLGRTLTAVYRSAGRRRQTLEEASFDTWIKFYRPDENSPNAHVSYYAKGAMLALALDLEMRLRTDDRVSLDDVMRLLWRHYGGDGAPGLPEGAFEELAAEASGLDLAAFFAGGVRGTVDPPVGILLAQFGVRLNLRAGEGGADAGGTPGARTERPRPWLGLRWRAVGGRPRVTHVLDAAPAQAAGVAAEDEILAVAGIRADAESFDAQVARLEPGRAVELHLFRRDEMLVLTIVPAEAPRDTCYLTLDTDAPAAALARRERWLAPRDG
ncbi:MAG: M61 family metallopeptidase [Gammaproteobacteria bacterium]|nr:M61 family metallopeptidase [Gammaproteobacteria bacterium]